MPRQLTQEPTIRVLIDLPLETSDKLNDIAQTQFTNRKKLIEKMIHDALPITEKATENYKKTFS